VNSTITYEFPLNERIRVFIRLEQLFQQFEHFLPSDTVADKRAAISALLDIMSIFRRNDLKSELLKELERDAKNLHKLAHYQDADAFKVDSLLAEISQISQNLYAVTGKIGIQVMESDLFQSITQRSSIPGGTCSFDLPEYHYWLEQDAERCQQDLTRWGSPFDDIHRAIALILTLLRNSGAASNVLATAGFFQFIPDKTQNFQLLKVTLDKSLSCFAEISGGKHRCSIRFMIPDDNNRPVQSSDNIPFQLTCCAF
jgi:cell division protein ZapD